MHRSRFLSQAVEDSEPTKNQNFTDLLAELRAAQVRYIRILTISNRKVCYKNPYVCKKEKSAFVTYE